MTFLTILLWLITWRWMMRTPLDPADARISGIVFAVLWALLIGMLWYRYWFRALRWVIAVAVFGVIVEYVGITTCVPYGCFEYSGLVGPQFMETFPRWLLVIRPLIVVSIVQFIPKWSANVRILASFVGWLFLMLFDMVLDPVAVAQWLWTYTDPGIWYGIPRSNFLWWIVTGTISCWLILWLSPIIWGDWILKKIGRFLTAMYCMAFLVVIGLVPVF